MPCIFQELHEVPSLRAIRTPSHHPHSHRDKPCSQRQAQAWPARPSRCPTAGWPAPKSPPSPSPWPPLSLEESLLELGQIKKLLNLVHSSPSESQGQESLQLLIARIRSLNQLDRSIARARVVPPKWAGWQPHGLQSQSSAHCPALGVAVLRTQLRGSRSGLLGELSINS